MKPLQSLLVTAGFALGFLPATGAAETFLINGHELTGETVTLDGDGSVRTVVQAGLNGSLHLAEQRERTSAHARITMTIVVNGDQLMDAHVDYAQFGRTRFGVTVPIDPCWFEYVNDRDATSHRFGEDIMTKVEAPAGPGAIDPSVKAWFVQRLALLAAKTAEGTIKSGVTLVPARR